MYDSRYPPQLQLRSTVSHPQDPAKVAGFKGRDIQYGRDAVALKLEEVPETEVGAEAQPVWGVFKQASLEVELGRALYLVGNDEVHAIQPEDNYLIEGIWFEMPDGEQLQLKALPKADFQTYARNEVDVGLE